jgi:hypothetical protein
MALSGYLSSLISHLGRIVTHWLLKLKERNLQAVPQSYHVKSSEYFDGHIVQTYNYLACIMLNFHVPSVL